MAEQDSLFCSLFRHDPEAAMLACDELGVLPDALLFIPKMVFLFGVEVEQQGMIRYNMRERFRQNTLRKLLARKRDILAAGNVEQRWEERQELFPEAPDPPLLRDPGPQSVSSRKDDDEALDTESEDDGLDEYFQPKPPPTPAQQSDSGDSSSRPFSGTTPHSVRRGDSMQLTLSMQGLGQTKAPKPPTISPPREPPHAKRLTAKQLATEERLLGVSRNRLTHYAKKVEGIAAAVRERSEERKHRTLQTPKQRTESAASARSDATSSSSRFPVLRALPSAPEAGSRELSALVRNTMVNIAKSAVVYTTYRDELDRQAEEDDERHSLRRQRNQGNDDAHREHLELLRKRGEAQRQAEEQLQDEYERFLEMREERTNKVILAQHQKHALTAEVIRMRQLFAAERRGWVARAQESKLTQIVARRDPKHQHAAQFLQNRQLQATINRQHHLQVELLRKDLKHSMESMQTKNQWEIPKSVQEFVEGEDGHAASEFEEEMD